jgi:hypothetical protein
MIENIDLSKLFTQWNVDDECWEILERNGIPDTPERPGDDALLAKFYDGTQKHCSPLAHFLVNRIQQELLVSGECEEP